MRTNYPLIFSITLVMMTGVVLESSALGSPEIAKDSTPQELGFKQLVNQTLPSMVQLTVLSKDGSPIALGSGFVVGYEVIATNYHVIKGAEGVVVNYSDGRSEKSPGLIVMDRSHDLVLLRASTSGVSPLKLSYTTPLLGEEVFAFGSPLGLTGTVSNGIVSALRIDNGANVVQTTCPISHGSSGGALVDMTGHVIGVTAYSNTDGENLNFAYSSSYLSAMLAKPFAAVRSWADEEQDQEQKNAVLLGLWHHTNSGELTFDGMGKLKAIVQSGADVNAHDKDGGPPLMFAVYGDEIDCAKFLMDNGADVNAQKNNGVTALMIASVFGKTDCVRLLLDNGADIDSKRSDGYTALIAASYSGEIDCVNLLLDHGADVNETTNNGMSALAIAKASNHPDVVQALINAGATN